MWRGYLLRFLGEPSASIPVWARPFVFGKARGLLRRASLRSAHPEDPAHLKRLVYLDLVRGHEGPDEVESVRDVFERKRRLDLEKNAARIPAFVFSVSLVAVLGAGAWVLLRKPTQPLPGQVIDPRAAMEDAAENEETVFFAETIPEFMIALNRAQAGTAQDFASYGDESVQRTSEVHGAALAEKWKVLKDALIALAFTPNPDAEVVATTMNAALLWNDALRDASKPYYLEVHPLISRRGGLPRIYASTYLVLQSRIYLAGQAQQEAQSRVRAVRIKRLDRLNYRESMLGYTRPELRDAIVLDNRMEAHLLLHVLPAIAQSDLFHIVRSFENETNTDWIDPYEASLRSDLERWAMRVVSNEGALRSLARLVVARERIFDRMESDASRQNMVLQRPDTLDIPEESYAQLARFLSPIDAQEMRSLQDQLTASDLREAWNELLGAMSASVERHEVQHRLDFESGSLVHVPEGLASHVGSSDSEDDPNDFAEHTNAEMSAYLSELARADEGSKARLALLDAFVMDRRAWGRAECYAALTIYEELARDAQLEHQPFIESRRIVRARVAQVHNALLQRSPVELAGLAKRAWERIYQRPLPELRVEN